MAYEMLVGLNVVDDELYSDYRAAMKPILAVYGGDFGCDFKVAEVLLPTDNPDINRVFTIGFPTQEQADHFFADPDYLGVKARYFEASVADTTILASYQRDS